MEFGWKIILFRFGLSNSDFSIFNNFFLFFGSCCCCSFILFLFSQIIPKQNQSFHSLGIFVNRKQSKKHFRVLTVCFIVLLSLIFNFRPI